MTFEELERDVIAWAKDRGILEKSDVKSQLLKTVSEVGELADAVNKGDYAEFSDAIGDVMVTLIILNHLRESEMVDSFEPRLPDGQGTFSIAVHLEMALEVISKRTGQMVGGVFVKDAA